MNLKSNDLKQSLKQRKLGIEWIGEWLDIRAKWEWAKNYFLKDLESQENFKSKFHKSTSIEWFLKKQ